MLDSIEPKPEWTRQAVHTASDSTC